MRRVKLFLSGWPDFFMTVAEAWLPYLGLPRLARYIAEKHYATGLHGPGAKENVLARTYEIAGDLTRAEECLRQAADLRPDAYGLLLGQFLARTGRRAAAIDAFERALGVTNHTAELEFIRKRLTELRQSDQGC